MRLGITMPSRTATWEQLAEYAALADQANFDSVWTYEVYRNPFTILCASAGDTRRVQLGTGLAAGFSRSPFELANAAADVDEISGGRMLLGIGTGVPEFLQAFRSTDAAKPAARMGEYLDVLRLSWQYLQTGQADAYEGDHLRFRPPPINPWGLREPVREQIPVSLAAMRPRLLDMVGRKADGWVGYLATPEFLEQKVIPPIEAGARSAGRDIDDIDLVADVICSVSPDREVALHRACIHVGFYLTHNVSDVVVELHGLQEQQAALRKSLMTEGLAGLAKTDDALVETFSITGTPEEARQRLDAFKDFKHVALHTPYVPPLDAAESDDAYRNIVETFARP